MNKTIVTKKKRVAGMYCVTEGSIFEKAHTPWEEEYLLFDGARYLQFLQVLVLQSTIFLKIKL